MILENKDAARSAAKIFQFLLWKCMKSIDFFNFYVVQKSIKFFLYDPKKLCQLQKTQFSSIKNSKKCVSKSQNNSGLGYLTKKSVSIY